MLPSFHNIKEMTLEKVEKRVRDNDKPYYVFTLEIRDEDNNLDILTFFSNDLTWLEIIVICDLKADSVFSRAINSALISSVLRSVGGCDCAADCSIDI